MESFLLTDRAKTEARKLLERFEETGSISNPPSEEYPISKLHNGQMLGVMISKKNGKEKVSYSFSGGVMSEYLVPGFVPPCFSVNTFHKVFDPYDREIHLLTEKIENGEKHLIKERKELSRKAQKEIGKIFTFYTWNGEKIHSLPEEYPTGTGECAGLKLINYALKNKREITSLAEFKYTKNLKKIEFYPPCDKRCGLLLPEILGLKYIYADEEVAVIDKKEGFLSVPGRVFNDSVSYRFHTLFPSSPPSPFPHRLDMDTSGVMVLAFNKESLSSLQRQFENHTTKKIYIAILEGNLEKDEGTIILKSHKDMQNPPKQVIDDVGKEGITHYTVLKRVKRNGKDYTRVSFTLETGRTHQLRLHSSYIGHPIVGDNLYGNKIGSERLYLHAESISFDHPKTGERMTLSSKCPF